ncbi:MAG: serine protease HtrA [Proteocatella sp.]
MNKNKVLLIAIISAIIGSMITIILLPVINGLPIMSNYSGGAQTTINVPEQDTENVYKAVIKKSMPSVVGITTVVDVGNLFTGPMQQTGIGTGVIVDQRGLILTNSHVIEDGAGKDVTVLFDDGSKTKAEILWNDKTLDLAMLKVNKTGLQVAELGDSDKVEVGDLAIAIGNPLGLEFQRTVTEGIISGLERKIQTDSNTTMDNLIQTSAAINPGNSGGPLLNTKGQVIGINTAKARSGEGLGFAIPINIAKPIVEQFIQTGSFEKVTLGIQGIDADYYKQATGIDPGSASGVFVAKVEANSVASKSGLQVNDVIVKMDDANIEKMQDLVKYLYTVKKGDSVKSVVMRDGKKVNLEFKF